jgi:hypothetical protein
MPPPSAVAAGAEPQRAELSGAERDRFNSASPDSTHDHVARTIYALVSFLYLMRWGRSASAPRRRLRSAS